jgi:DnaJ-class molecular chaperone
MARFEEIQNNTRSTKMSEPKTHPCPTCQGKKVIEGVCETSPEWQGEDDDGMVCTPETKCPTCQGTGVEVLEDTK